MEKVQDLRPADTREKVFVTAGKPDDLMREDRPDDHELVVIEDPAVDSTGTSIANSPPESSLISFDGWCLARSGHRGSAIRD